MTSGPPDGLDVNGAESRRFGRTTGGGRELRERTLDCLRRADGPLPLAEVAWRVVADESERDPPSAPCEDVQRVYLSLVRYQVPELERRGVVEYSEAEGTLELAGPGTP